MLSPITRNTTNFVDDYYNAYIQGGARLDVIDSITIVLKKGLRTMGLKTTITIQVTKKIGSKKKRKVFNRVRLGKYSNQIYKRDGLSKTSIKILNVSHRKSYYYPLIYC